MSVENYRLIMKEGRGRIMGPVDYLVVKFPGSKFTGKIIPELADLVKRDIIRILDLVVVNKDENGNLTIIEAKDLKGEANELADLVKDTGEWFYEGDINALAESLEANSTAGVLLVENVWAIHFKEDLLDANAELIEMGRIPPETIAQVERALMAQGGT